MGFSLLQKQNYGVSCYNEFDSILETETHQEDYIVGLLNIINTEPDFLDAYAHIGLEYFNNDDLSEAEKIYRKGLDIALGLIPEDFKGNNSMVTP